MKYENYFKTAGKVQGSKRGVCAKFFVRCGRLALGVYSNEINQSAAYSSFQ